MRLEIALRVERAHEAILRDGGKLRDAAGEKLAELARWRVARLGDERAFPVLGWNVGDVTDERQRLAAHDARELGAPEHELARMAGVDDEPDDRRLVHELERELAGDASGKCAHAEVFPLGRPAEPLGRERDELARGEKRHVMAALRVGQEVRQDFELPIEGDGFPLGDVGNRVARAE